MMRRLLRSGPSLTFALACLAVLVAAESARAQTVTGTLQGTVTDSSGAVLPGASITIRNDETGGVREVITNDVGFYAAPYLPIGRYTVTAKLDGFQTVVREGVQVSLNDTRVLNFEQKPASVAETVTVTGEAPRINSTNAEVKGVLTEQQIIDKPALNPGSFLDLASIFPGFQENPTSGQNNPTASSGSSINFNGTGSRGATFQINGVNNDDSSENQNRQGASLSTIKEFQVLSNTYSAEFGRGYGAVVLVQTKSGTNRWRGDAYWYLQDSNDLTALRKFATVKPDNQRNQYRRHAGVPDQQEPAVRVRQLRPHEVRGHAELRAGHHPAFRDRQAVADARQRHRAEPQLDQRNPCPLSAERHPERSAQQPDVRHGPGVPVSRRGLFGPPRLAAGPGRRLGPLSVHAPDPRNRRHHPRRERQAGQRSAEPRRDVDADRPQQRRGRVPLRPRHAQHQCEHRRG